MSQLASFINPTLPFNCDYQPQCSYYYPFIAIIQVNLHLQSPSVINWGILLSQNLLPTCPCWWYLLTGF